MEFYTFWSFFGCLVCGFLVPPPATEPGCWQWEHWTLTTGPPGDSLSLWIFLCWTKWEGTSTPFGGAEGKVRSHQSGEMGVISLRIRTGRFHKTSRIPLEPGERWASEQGCGFLPVVMSSCPAGLSSPWPLSPQAWRSRLSAAPQSCQEEWRLCDHPMPCSGLSSHNCVLVPSAPETRLRADGNF